MISASNAFDDSLKPLVSFSAFSLFIPPSSIKKVMISSLISSYVFLALTAYFLKEFKPKPILEINKIKTIFWKKSERFSDDEIVLAYDENITPEQKSFLQGHNFLKYPTIQKLSVNKVSENISSDQTVSKKNNVDGENSGGNVVSFNRLFFEGV